MVASRNRKSDEDTIRELTEFKGDYLPLDKDRLVLFAVDFLQSNNIEPTFDKVVAATFKLFPKKFSLVGFPEYPDGRTIYYCVFNHCTITKKWLTGSVQSGFRVTERGRYFLEETKKMLEGKIRVTKKYSVVAKRKELTFINLLKKSPAYQKYERGNKEEITESEIFDSIRVQPNSRNLIEKHLEKYSDYANRLNETSVMNFLQFVRKRLGGE